MAKKARKKSSKKTSKKAFKKTTKKKSKASLKKPAAKKKSMKKKKRAAAKGFTAKVSGAYQTVIDTIKGTDQLRNKLEPPATSETE